MQTRLSPVNCKIRISQINWLTDIIYLLLYIYQPSVSLYLYTSGSTLQATVLWSYRWGRGRALNSGTWRYPAHRYTAGTCPRGPGTDAHHWSIARWTDSLQLDIQTAKLLLQIIISKTEKILSPQKVLFQHYFEGDLKKILFSCLPLQSEQHFPCGITPCVHLYIQDLLVLQVTMPSEHWHTWQGSRGDGQVSPL